MHIHRPKITQHRLQRYVLWTLAMLAWFAAVMFEKRGISARHLAQRGDVSIAMLSRMTISLLIIRASRLLGRRPHGRVLYWRRGRDLRRRHLSRSLLGVKLRRALKHKDLATHISRLVDVLHNLDRYAAQLAQRFRRLRRLWRLVPAIAPSPVMLGAPALSPACVNSS